MAETEWLTDEQQRAWRGLLEVNAQLTVALHRRLQASSGLSLADYDILVALTDVPGRSLRMYEIGERLQWEKSRVSKQVARMAARGLVRRRECIDDRRGAFVDLTEEGQAAIEAAAPDHVRLVRSVVFDVLTEEQVGQLTRITESVLGSLAEERKQSDEGRRAS
ncbi:MarR family transcriptional regulator [Nocardioides sp. GY 10113]|uniref:MarR family winged helix-turn-helix transcriptional regulator n=1 Tax=Nocardioides sp. GY 10113 TaxID=2569761 RepID=UPI0010A93BD2|nr:MarR family transcriptional regulator [Nocardioides sp. GY 10113]TIC89163.1 MarR family transcriptional regulator [Nocardioides sp. GY 10113]